VNMAITDHRHRAKRFRSSHGSPPDTPEQRALTDFLHGKEKEDVATPRVVNDAVTDIKRVSTEAVDARVEPIITHEGVRGSMPADVIHDDEVVAKLAKDIQDVVDAVASGDDAAVAEARNFVAGDATATSVIDGITAEVTGPENPYEQGEWSFSYDSEGVYATYQPAGEMPAGFIVRFNENQEVAGIDCADGYSLPDGHEELVRAAVGKAISKEITPGEWKEWIQVYKVSSSPSPESLPDALTQSVDTAPPSSVNKEPATPSNPGNDRRESARTRWPEVTSWKFEGDARRGEVVLIGPLADGSGVIRARLKLNARVGKEVTLRKYIGDRAYDFRKEDADEHAFYKRAVLRAIGDKTDELASDLRVFAHKGITDLAGVVPEKFSGQGPEPPVAAPVPAVTIEQSIERRADVLTWTRVGANELGCELPTGRIIHVNVKLNRVDGEYVPEHPYEPSKIKKGSATPLPDGPEKDSILASVRLELERRRLDGRYPYERQPETAAKPQPSEQEIGIDHPKEIGETVEIKANVFGDWHPEWKPREGRGGADGSYVFLESDGPDGMGVRCVVGIAPNGTVRRVELEGSLPKELTLQNRLREAARRDVEKQLSAGTLSLRELKRRVSDDHAVPEMVTPEVAKAMEEVYGIRKREITGPEHPPKSELSPGPEIPSPIQPPELTARPDIPSITTPENTPGTGGESVEPLPRPPSDQAGRSVIRSTARGLWSVLGPILGASAPGIIKNYVQQRFAVRGFLGRGGLEEEMQKLLHTVKEKKETPTANVSVREALKKFREGVGDAPLDPDQKNHSMTRTRQEGAIMQHVAEPDRAALRQEMAKVLWEHRKMRMRAKRGRLEGQLGAEDTYAREGNLSSAEHAQNRQELEQFNEERTRREFERRAEEMDRAIRDCVKNYATTKINGMRTVKESLNTVLVASSAVVPMALAGRGVMYGAMSVAERHQRLNREYLNRKAEAERKAGRENSRRLSKAKDGEPVERVTPALVDRPEFWENVIKGGFWETMSDTAKLTSIAKTFVHKGRYRNWSKEEKAQGLRTAQALGSIARTVGIGKSALTVAVGWDAVKASFSIDQILAHMEEHDGILGSTVGSVAAGFKENVVRTFSPAIWAKDWVVGHGRVGVNLSTSGGGGERQMGGGGGILTPEAGDRSVDITNEMHLPSKWTAGITHEGGHSIVHVYDDRGVVRVMVPDTGGLTTEGIIRIADERVAENHAPAVPVEGAGSRPSEASAPPHIPPAVEQAQGQSAGRSSKQPGIYAGTSAAKVGLPAGTSAAEAHASEAPIVDKSGAISMGGLPDSEKEFPPSEMSWTGKVGKGDSILELLKHAYEKNAENLGYTGDINNAADLRAWAETTSTRQFVADYLWDYGRPGAAHHDAEAAAMWQKLVGNSEVPSPRELLDSMKRLSINDFNHVLQDKAANLVFEKDDISLDDKGNIHVAAPDGTERLGHIPERGSRAGISTADVAGADRSGVTREIIWQDNVDNKGVLTRTSHFNAIEFDRFMDNPDVARSHLPSDWTVDFTADEHGVPEHAIIKNALGDQVVVLENDQWDDPSTATHEFTKHINDELGRMTGRTANHEALANIPAEHLRGSKSSVIEDKHRSGLPVEHNTATRGHSADDASTAGKEVTHAVKHGVSSRAVDHDRAFLGAGKGGKTVALAKQFQASFGEETQLFINPHGAAELRNDTEVAMGREMVADYLRLFGQSLSGRFNIDAQQLFQKVGSQGVDLSTPEGVSQGLDNLSAKEIRYVLKYLIPEAIKDHELRSLGPLGFEESSKVDSEVGIPAGTSAAEIGVPAGTSAAEVGVPAGTTAAEEGLPAGTSAAEVGLPASTSAAEIGVPASTSAAEVGSSSGANIITEAIQSGKGERGVRQAISDIFGDKKQTPDAEQSPTPTPDLSPTAEASATETSDVSPTETPKSELSASETGQTLSEVALETVDPASLPHLPNDWRAELSIAPDGIATRVDFYGPKGEHGFLLNLNKQHSTPELLRRADRLLEGREGPVDE